MSLHAGFIDEDPHVASLIGIFVARWSLAEMALIMPLTVATGSPQEVCASMLSATNSAEGKIKLVRSALSSAPRIHPTVDMAALDRALRDFLSACQSRNELMHHLWAKRSDGSIVTVDYRKSETSPDRVRARTIEGLVEACNRAVDIAYRLCSSTGSLWVTEEAVRRLALQPA